MKRAVCVCIAMVAAVVGVLRCQASSIRPSLVGLKHAQEIEEKFQIIEKILGNSTKTRNCSSLKLTEEGESGKEEAAKEESAKEESDKEEADAETEMESKSDATTPTFEYLLEKEFRREEHKDDDELEDENEEKDERKEETDDHKCDYKEIHVNHTMLLEPTTCNVTSTDLSEEERELILKLHNELRAKVAKGDESEGDPGPQPSAANMHQLVWNDELAEIAKAWAAQCPSGHDEEPRRRLCSRKYRIGQNINYYWGVYDEGPLWEKAVENWYSEVKDVDAKVASSFVPHSTKKIGHYTQLIWAASKEIGCGIVYYKTERKGLVYNSSITHVCNYGPAGNVLKQPLYEIGEAASKCPGNVSSEYPALCL